MLRMQIHKQGKLKSYDLDTQVVIQNICPLAYIILLDWKVFYFSYELFPCDELRQRGKKESYHIDPSQGSLNRPKLRPQRTLSWSLKHWAERTLSFGTRNSSVEPHSNRTLPGLFI